MPPGPILGDHRRIRKKLVPPLLQLGTMHLTSWPDVGLPEVIWFAVFHDLLGLQDAVALITNLTEATVSVSNKTVLFVSDFTGVEPEKLSLAVAELSPGYRSLLDDVLSRLLALYPECPLSPLQRRQPVNDATPQDVAWIKSLIAQLLDRTSRVATLAQASAVYFAKLQHRFSTFPGSSLSNFSEIENYPSTPESQHVASGVRGMLNMLIYREEPAAQNAWARYFWNQNFQLEPCYFSAGSPDGTE